MLINDLDIVLLAHSLLFAGVLKIYIAINNLPDCYDLQANLTLLEEWCITNINIINLK